MLVSAEPLTEAEKAADELLTDAHLCAPHQLPGLLARHGERLGVTGALVFLADLQQDVLVPFLASNVPVPQESLEVLGVDTTLAGRAYQRVEVLSQELPDGRAGVWLPLLAGSDRLGVLFVAVNDLSLAAEGSALLTRLRRFASMTAELLVTNTMYGDTLVRLRRRGQMGLAGEMQWSLLPPLTFACHEVTVAAALEPAYEVAGDTVDYAVDAGRVRVGVFDGMGHGLQSAQLASLSVAAYRNARRSDRRLIETAQTIDGAVFGGFGGEAFTTAVLAELDTDTGVLSWINAGHPEPLLMRAGRLVKSLHAEPAAPLGLGWNLAEAAGAEQGRPGQDRPFVIGVEQLEAGDRVLFYTDGVTEARSPTGDFFGVQGLVDLADRHFARGLPAPESMRRIVRALLVHQQGQLSDDATMLLLEWRSGKEEALRA
jgi:serine phosphatase RsbU (regulator of sigma subunit)